MPFNLSYVSRAISALVTLFFLGMCAIGLQPDPDAPDSRKDSIIEATKDVRTGTAYEKVAAEHGMTCVRYACQRGCEVNPAAFPVLPDEVMYCQWSEVAAYSGGLRQTVDAQIYLHRDKVLNQVHTTGFAR